MGLACVHWMDGDYWSRFPYCMDCNYLIDNATGYGYGGEPWAHRMVVASEHTENEVSASSHCQSDWMSACKRSTRRPPLPLACR